MFLRNCNAIFQADLALLRQSVEDLEKKVDQPGVSAGAEETSRSCIGAEPYAMKRYSFKLQSTKRDRSDTNMPAAQSQANSKDVLTFSRSQLSHVVDFTIAGFAKKHGLPADMFSDIAVMAKQALPDASVISEDPKDIPQKQVQKLIEVVTEGCRETAAKTSKDKSENDAHCQE